jgi:glucosylglycerate synthase
MVSTGLNSSEQEAELTPGADNPAADIVVGLTSDNDVATIGEVVRTVQAGLTRSLHAHSVRFVLADAGSDDGTRDAAIEAAQPSPLVLVEYKKTTKLRALAYHGQVARPAALRAILQAARQLEAKACAVIDARLQTVGPEWIERLVGPVLTDAFDYISPNYLRHPNEGAISKSIVYPMFRALYGVRLRQPAASDFGCSRRVLEHYLEQDFWDAEQARWGIDLWLATAAVSGGFRACEAALGPRRIATRGTPVDLSTTLAQLVGALFAELDERADLWQRVRSSSPIPVFGTAPVGLQSERPPLNVDSLIESFRLGYRELREIWTWVLPPRTIVELRKLTEATPERFRFDDRLWATIIYDFALGYSLGALPRDHLLRSLTPLYTGWLAAFVLHTENATPNQVEQRIEELCLAFEAEKRHLISRWRWPERLR